MRAKNHKSVILTDEEKEIIESASKKVGLSYNSFFVSCGLKEAMRLNSLESGGSAV